MEKSKSCDFDFSSIPDKTVIGLTGPIAGGKSFVLSCFEKFGAGIVSADKLNSEILNSSEIFAIISARYSGTPVIKDGKIDKAALAEQVFSSISEKKWLEDLLHPKILRKAFDVVKNSKKELIAVEMPLLFEAGLKEKFDFTLCISADEDKLYERAASRGWSREHYKLRCLGQFTLKQKCSLADLIIQNNGTLSDIENKIRKICFSFFKHCKLKNQ